MMRVVSDWRSTATRIESLSVLASVQIRERILKRRRMNSSIAARKCDRGPGRVLSRCYPLPFPPQLRKSMRELTSVRTPTKTGTNSFSVIIRSISGFWVPPLLFRLPAHFPFNLRASLQGDLWRTAIIKVSGDIWIMNIRTLQEILEIRNLEDRIWNFMR